LLPVQTPLWQVSVCVHMLLSLHDVPFATFAGVEHCPVDVLHVLAILHAVAAAQVTGLLPVQCRSGRCRSACTRCRRRTPSRCSRSTASSTCRWTCCRCSAVLHAVAAAQVTGLPPVHAPLWQVSVCVHALPSLHVVPLVAFVGDEHTPVLGLHVPAT
jgi:hypothetical protein